VYLAPFEAAIEAGVASVMCSYNHMNGSYACGNRPLLTDVLRDETRHRDLRARTAHPWPTGFTGRAMIDSAPISIASLTAFAPTMPLRPPNGLCGGG
jgi:hypothetical protein